MLLWHAGCKPTGLPCVKCVFTYLLPAAGVHFQLPARCSADCWRSQLHQESRVNNIRNEFNPCIRPHVYDLMMCRVAGALLYTLLPAKTKARLPIWIAGKDVIPPGELVSDYKPIKGS